MKLEKKIKQTEKAIQRLEALLAVDLDENDYVIDAAIQRFEFCYELVWKTLKLVLVQSGVECSTPRDVFKKLFSMGILKMKLNGSTSLI